MVPVATSWRSSLGVPLPGHASSQESLLQRRPVPFVLRAESEVGAVDIARLHRGEGGSDGFPHNYRMAAQHSTDEFADEHGVCFWSFRGKTHDSVVSCSTALLPRMKEGTGSARTACSARGERK